VQWLKIGWSGARTGVSFCKTRSHVIIITEQPTHAPVARINRWVLLLHVSTYYGCPSYASHRHLLVHCIAFSGCTLFDFFLLMTVTTFREYPGRKKMNICCLYAAAVGYTLPTKSGTRSSPFKQHHCIDPCGRDSYTAAGRARPLGGGTAGGPGGPPSLVSSLRHS